MGLQSKKANDYARGGFCVFFGDWCTTASNGRINLRSSQDIWIAALGELQLQVSKPNFDTWLKDTTGLHYADTTFTIGTPNVFVAEWLEHRLHSVIKRTLSGIIGTSVNVHFQIHMPDSAPAQKTPALQTDGGISVKEREPITRPNLNSRYTFDTFISGECNRMAYAAALEAAEMPGSVYNPLFIYGKTAVGKTHLIHAIGNALINNGRNVVYTNGQRLTNEFVLALKTGRMDDFNQKYRNLDALLFDDIQFLSGKTGTQECFANIFIDLYDTNCQIVISSDVMPKAIESLDEKLRSRLEGGLVVDIQLPDHNTRRAILKTKAQHLGVELSPEAIDFLATRFPSNVREIEGALMRVITYTKLSGGELSTAACMQALAVLDGCNEYISGGKDHTPPASAIIDAVAAYHGLSSDVLKGNRRDKRTAYVRHIAMYLLREQTNTRLAEIGRLLGGRNHSTIVHGCERIAAELSTNPQLEKTLDTIKKSLKK